jgi:hypothetical protein
MNTFEQNEAYFKSNEHKIWLELAKNKPKQEDVGYWVCYFEREKICWKFIKPI